MIVAQQPGVNRLTADPLWGPSTWVTTVTPPRFFMYLMIEIDSPWLCDDKTRIAIEESDRDIAEGRYKDFSTVDELLAHLNSWRKNSR